MKHLQDDVLSLPEAPVRHAPAAGRRSAHRADAETIIGEARNGRTFVLVDDLGATVTASLMVPAQMATPSAINFMATCARGIICLALEQRRVVQLGLTLQPRRHAGREVEKFALSIEASDGVSTGISAQDRARTIAVAIDEAGTSGELVTPGHVFPIVTHDGGVLTRAGHAEAVVDICRLAGLQPSGVICTILDAAGDIAGFDAVDALAQAHELRIGLMSDLVAYRCRHDPLLQHCGVAPLATNIAGIWQLHTFLDRLSGAKVIALQSHGTPSGEPVLACLSTVSILANVPGQGDAETDRLRNFMDHVAVGKTGIVILQQPATLGGLEIEHEAQAWKAGQVATAAQILAQLAITSVSMVDGSDNLCAALTAYGIHAESVDRAVLQRSSSSIPNAVSA